MSEAKEIKFGPLDEDGKVTRLPKFDIVAVWEGTVIEDHQKDEFEQFFIDKMGVRVQLLETILTKPDVGVPDTGGRCDIFLAIHEDDVAKFAVPRLGMGIRWLEDVVSKVNGYPSNPIYPDYVLEYLK